MSTPLPPTNQNYVGPDNHNSSPNTRSGSSRPVLYNRTNSEADRQRRPSYTNIDSERERRASLGRGMSTSLLEGNTSESNNEQGTAATAANPTSSVEFALGQSWSSGFGEITDISVFGQSWTSRGGGGTGVFDISNRRGSTGSSMERPLAPLPTGGPRSASLGAASIAGGSGGGGGGGGVGPGPILNGNGVSSAMHDAARLKDWQSVYDICQRDPDSAAFAGAGGFTALHYICNYRCPRADVAEAVIRAYPDSLSMLKIPDGWTPLHLACRFKCDRDVVRALLNVHPEKGKKAVSKPDRKRRTPLYYAVRYDAPPGVVPQLLEVDPSVVLGDDEHIVSPLAVFWDDFAEKMEGARMLHPYVDQNDSNPEELRERIQRRQDSVLLSNWRRANMFLKAAFRFPVDENDEFAGTPDRRWRILHATAAVKCHITLFRMACALYPEQASEMDENDLYFHLNEAGENERRRQTALHLASSSNASGSSGNLVITTLLRLFPGAARFADEIDGSYPLHRIVENKHKRHWSVDGIDALYTAFPVAVESTDMHGRLPLHRAAAAVADQEDDAEDLATRSIICNLVQVHPQGAAVPDSDGCLPLHLLAMKAGKWNEEVQALFAAHQAAVSVRSGRQLHNSLPIHLAAANPNARLSLIERFIEHNPRGLSQADGQGKLPLHLACELGKHWEEDGLESIYNAFPQAVRIREDNERHWMALHMASASNTACSSLIKKLVELHPEACEVSDSEGRLPLHLACESGKAWEGGLGVLFEGNPLAIGSPDNHGRLPLFIVAEKYALAAQEAAPVDGDAEAMERPEPTDTPARNAGELDVLFNLVRSDPSTIPESR